MIPVVVSTGVDRTDWLRDCLASLTPERVTIARPRTGGELGAIKMIHESTHWSRWLLIQDSCLVLDEGFWDLVGSWAGPALLCPRPSMYMAIYERRVLEQMDIPDVAAGLDRGVSIHYETEWMDRYVWTAETLGMEVPVLMPDFTDANAQRTEFHNGRLNLVLENKFLRKYKGTWR